MEENDYPLSEKEEILESQFGKINTNEAYYEWAKKATNLSEEEIKEMIENIIKNIYDLRDPEIFDHLPNIKLAIASNHLSTINIRIDNMELREKFDYILISADKGIKKPNKEFYEELITELKELPENILFVDDSLENIEAAKNMWFMTLHYDRTKSLTEEVIKTLT